MSKLKCQISNPSFIWILKFGFSPMGSVKDLQIIKEPTKDSSGTGRFAFSDRYSVFDWGEMPDHIPNKGTAISILAAYYFERLEAQGVPTHYIGLIEDGVAKKLSELKRPTNVMEVNLFSVVRPELQGGKYDYSRFQKERGGFLIPLEVIYRNSLPEGSSVFKRLREGTMLKELDHVPAPGEKLSRPIIDFSTKLEITDRYLSLDEAQRISGVSDDEMAQLKRCVDTINAIITAEVSKIGLTNEDGKIEFAFDAARRLTVVDVVGTLDECRFTYEGLPVSKEIARIYYRNTEWYQAVEDAKEKDRHRWKEICKLKPQPLPDKLKLAISQVYCACTNEITGREWFERVPPLEKIAGEIKRRV